MDTSQDLIPSDVSCLARGQSFNCFIISHVKAPSS